ncbi:hypothetical protein [Rufibacter sp. LB8]|uniref:hypothetical protein n=1 Tax=Rufibacter sp. LB8 TaxID=2777781 RepID=UPI001CEF7464|nr:hypothetical protein [Rufibacter sp. LB8]
MILRRTVIFSLTFFISTLTFAQEIKSESNPKWDFGLEGMLGITAGKNFYAL